MVRKQIYITDDYDKELQLMVALGQGTYSELVRKGIGKLVDKQPIKQKKKFDPWKDFIGMGGKGGPKDLSKNMDYYLYVEPYENKKKK